MMQERHRRIGLWLPLVFYVVPTLAIGYGYVIPSSCIAGINALTLGFAGSILGACITYVAGVTAALRHRSRGRDSRAAREAR